MREPQIPSVVWFRDHYDRILSEHPGAVEIVQRPGDTVYVPAGWPHVVLNLEMSVAITHNYASEYPSVEKLLASVRDTEPQWTRRFARALRRHRPDLLRRSIDAQRIATHNPAIHGDGASARRRDVKCKDARLSGLLDLQA